jgi:hypothetical protein
MKRSVFQPSTRPLPLKSVTFINVLPFSLHLTLSQSPEASSSRSLPSLGGRPRLSTIFLEPERLKDVSSSSSLEHVAKGKFPTYESQLYALCDVLPPRPTADRLVRAYREEISWLCPMLLWPLFEVPVSSFYFSRLSCSYYIYRLNTKSTGCGWVTAANSQSTLLGWPVTRTPHLLFFPTGSVDSLS